MALYPWLGGGGMHGVGWNYFRPNLKKQCGVPQGKARYYPLLELPER